MRFPRLSSLVSLALVWVFAATAHADVGPPLILDITPDYPMIGGETVNVELSDGTFLDFGFLFLGPSPGQFPFGELVLDIDPVNRIFLGRFPPSGTITLSTQVPNPIPPELSGLTFFLQGASVGIRNGGGLEWRKSNTDTISFE